MPEDEKSWTRLTLRLPAKLHQRLLDFANGRSLNTTIVRLVEQALDEGAQKPHGYDEIRNAIMEEVAVHLDHRFEEWRRQIMEDEVAQNLRDDPDYRP